MSNKIIKKCFFALGVAIIAFFWGGNGLIALAQETFESGTSEEAANVLTPTATSEQMNDQINKIRDQIAQLTKELQEQGKTESPIVTPPTKKMTLAEIESEVNRIAKEKDRIAKEVIAIVAARKAGANIYAQIEETLNQISQKANLIASEFEKPVLVAAAQIKESAPPVFGEEAIKKQIVSIQEKILTLESQMGQEATTSAESVTQPEEQEQTVPEITTEQPSEPIVIVKEPEAPKGLWQTIVDFFKNLFSF